MGLPTNADLQIHKFLKTADEMLGTIDNLHLECVELDRPDETVPQLGSVRDMATRLVAKLQELVAN